MTKRRSKLENIDKAGIQKMSHLTPTCRNSGTAPNNPPAFQFSFPIGLAALWDERFINHAETKQCLFTADSWHCISDLLNGKVVDAVHLLEIKNRDWWGDQTSVVVFSCTQSVCAARQTFVPHHPCLHLCATCWARRHLSAAGARSSCHAGHYHLVNVSVTPAALAQGGWPGGTCATPPPTSSLSDYKNADMVMGLS